MMTENIRLKLKLIFVPGQGNNYRPKFLESRVLIWCLLALFILKLITVPFLIYFPKSVFFSAIVKTTLIELLNQERQSLGLQPLKENAELNRAALLKAQDILEKDYFSHQSPEGVIPWYWFKIAGYNYKFAGENLAVGFLDSQEVNQAWLDSSSHRANLLNPNYKDVGIAIARGNFQENETTVVVQLFGTSQQPASGPKVETKEVVKKEEVSPEKVEKKETEKETLSAEFVPMEKQVVPALGEEDKSSSSPFTAARVKEAQEKITFNLFSFFASHYYRILQFIIYGFLGLIILVFIINIVVRFDVQHWDLILKALGFIVLLVLFALIDKGVIIKLIPHNFNIY